MKNKLFLSLLVFALLSSTFPSIAQPWVRQFDNNQAQNNWARVVKTVIIGQEQFTLFQRTSQVFGFSIVVTNLDGQIIRSHHYSDFNAQNMTVLRNSNDLFISGNSSGQGASCRINSTNGNILRSQLYSNTTQLIDAEQLYNGQNNVIILGQNGTSSVVMVYNTANNTVASSRTVVGNYGYGLAVSQLNNNILIGVTQSGNNSPTRIIGFSFNAATNTLQDMNINPAAGLNAWQINTNANSNIDAMCSVPNSDNIIFGYAEWVNGDLLSGVGALEFNGINNSYSINFGDQSRFDFNNQRRIFDLSVSPNGDELSVGMLSANSVELAIQRTPLTNFTLGVSWNNNIYETYADFNIPTQGLSQIVGTFDANGNLYTAGNLNNTNNGNIFYYANHPPLGDNHSCFRQVQPVHTDNNRGTNNFNFASNAVINATNLLNNNMTPFNANEIICSQCSNDLRLEGTYTTSSVYEGRIRIIGDVVFDGNIDIDFTNCDIIFDNCGSLTFTNGAFLRSNNSVYRTCEEDGIWDGIHINSNRNHHFNECLIKNSINGLHLFGATQTISILSSTFKDNFRGIIIDNVALDGLISSNTFDANRETTLLNENPCDNTQFLDLNYNGIRILSSDIASKIANNSFINHTITSGLIGIFMNSSTAEITDNKFVNNRHGIHLEGASLSFNNSSLVKANTFESNTKSTVSHQLNFLDITRPLLVLSNSFKGEFSNSTIQSGQGVDAIHGSTSQFQESLLNGIFINNNVITNYTTGVFLSKVSNSNVLENSIKSCQIAGVSLNQAHGITVSCNDIDLDFGSLIFPNSTGVLGTDINPNSKFYSNCVSDCNYGMHFQSGGMFNTVPDIKNNFFYNYTTIGLDFFNLSGDLGNSSSPGLNTFYTNFTNTNDVFANNNLTINCSGNYIPFHRVATNIKILSNSFSHSSASCAKQILERSVQSNFNNDHICTPLQSPVFGTIVPEGGNNLGYAQVSNNTKYNSWPNEFIISSMNTNPEVFNSVKFSDEEKQNTVNLYTAFLKSAGKNISVLKDLNGNISANTINYLEQKSNFLYSPAMFQNQRANGENSLENQNMNLFISNAYPILNGLEKNIGQFNQPASKTFADILDFEIFPNPAKDITTILVNNPEMRANSITLIDASGRTLDKWSRNDFTINLKIPLFKYSSGVYFISVTNGTASSVKKVIIN